MLLAVREIMDAGAPLPIRIGVNRGSVFVGEVGPPTGGPSPSMGDAVNLAARLMAKAETGQILSTPELLARSRTRFETVDLEPFYVKGKSRPVQAQAVGRVVGVRAGGGRRSSCPCSAERPKSDSWPSWLPRPPPGKARWSRSSARPGQASRGWSRRCARLPRTGCS